MRAAMLSPASALVLLAALGLGFDAPALGDDVRTATEKIGGQGVRQGCGDVAQGRRREGEGGVRALAGEGGELVAHQRELRVEGSVVAADKARPLEMRLTFG